MQREADDVTFTLIADDLEATDAGDAVNRALLNGSVTLSTGTGKYRVFSLTDGRDYDLALTITDLGLISP